MDLLQQEAKLSEIVRLVGVEALSAKEQMVLETAKSIREDFLQQNGFDEIDTYTSTRKMYLMIKSILTFHQQAVTALANGKTLKEIVSLPVKEKIAKNKMVEESNLSALEKLISEIQSSVQ